MGEDRLKFYETGDAPTKNIDVMKLAIEEAEKAAAEAIAKDKKSKKKRKSGVEAATEEEPMAEEAPVENGEKKKKKKKRKSEGIADGDETLNSTMETSTWRSPQLKNLSKTAAKRRKRRGK